MEKAGRMTATAWTGASAKTGYAPAWVAQADSFVNFAAKVGIGAGSIADGATYQPTYKSRNRYEIESCYCTNWIAGLAVDLPAEDMTRAGVTFGGTGLQPDELDALNEAMHTLGITPALAELLQWGRLYGGAIAVICIDGQDPETPLEIDSVSRNAFKGLLVFDRWQAIARAADPITTPGPDFGLPSFYDIMPGQAMQSMTVHHSRVIRAIGDKLPYWRRITEQMWGQSVLERIWDRITAFDSATHGAGQLVYRAHLRTWKIKGLRDIISHGGADGSAMQAGLVKNIEFVRQCQANEGITVLDDDDTFETHTYSFSGLSDIIMQFGQQISGAIQVPLTRLFGQSPAGLSSTGESDLRTYYDGIDAERREKLLRPLKLLARIMARSELGRTDDPLVTVEFGSLWSMSSSEQADIAQKGTATITQAHDSGLIDTPTAMAELRQFGADVGMFSNITDEAIRAASIAPPPMAPPEADPLATPQ